MFRRLVAAVLALALITPLSAAAQGYGGRAHGPGGGFGERGGYAGAPRGYGGGERGYGPDPQGGGYRQPPPNVYRGPPRGPQGPMFPGGAGGFYAPGPRRLTRGQYMPPEARGAVVQNFAQYHLRRPPRGYYWYRAGEDFVLASATTGLIFEVIPAEGY
jgi:hypothetical protein